VHLQILFRYLTDHGDQTGPVDPYLMRCGCGSPARLTPRLPDSGTAPLTSTLTDTRFCSAHGRRSFPSCSAGARLLLAPRARPSTGRWSWPRPPHGRGTPQVPAAGRRMTGAETCRRCA